MYNLDRLLKIYQHLLYQYYLIGRIVKDSTFSIFNVWDTFILKQVSIVYLKLKFTWRILGFFCCCYHCLLLCCLCSLESDDPTCRPLRFHNWGTTGFIYNKNNQTRATSCSFREEKNCILMELSLRFKINKSPGWKPLQHYETTSTLHSRVPRTSLGHPRKKCNNLAFVPAD